jgi:gliding motility-associated-like protein
LTSSGSGGIVPYTFQWSNGGGTDSTAIVSPTTTTNYIVTITDGCGNTATDNAIVGIGSGLAFAGNDTAICIGGTASLVGSGGIGYQWSNNIYTANNPVNPVQTTTYYLTVSGSCDGFDTVTVFVNPLPVITAATSVSSICPGTSVTLTAGGGTSYSWTSLPADPSLSGQQTSPNPVVSPTQATVYSLAGVDANTCSNTASVSVNILPIPVASFTINPQIVCIGEDATITFNGNAATSATYTWDFGGGTATGSGQGPYQVNWPTDGIKTITLSINDNGCQSLIFSATITVNPVPTAMFSATNTTGCAPLTVNFLDNSLSVTSSTEYLWNFGDQTISTTQNPTHTYITPGAYSVTLTITNGNTCISVLTIPMLVNAYASPNAEFVTTPHVVSIFDPSVYFHDLSTGSPLPVSWDWTLGDGTTQISQNFTYSYADTGIFLVTLMVHDINGCYDSAYNYVYVNPDYTIFIPSAFSPNDNLNNDYFQAYGVNLLAFNMKIFNRWGERLFESSDLRDGWDGKMHGIEAPLGVYVYVIYYMDALHKEHTVYGHLTLLR